jgi:ribonuclease HI
VLEHLEQLDTLVVGGKGGAANPVSLALLDLAHDLNKVRSEYEVVVGDWNVRNPRGKASTSAARRRNTAMVSRFAAQRGLVDPLKSRMDWGEEEPVTYTSGERRSWIDYFLVSKKLEDRGLVRAAGVLAEPINESDHRPVMLDIDADTALGRSRLWDDIKEAQEESDKSNRNAKFKAVQLGKVGRIKCYQEAVEKKWPEEGQLSNEITEFCSMVNEMGSRVWEDKAVEEEMVTQGNRLMTEALGAMLSGQETVYNKLPVVGRRGAGGQRKHQSSPVYVKLAQEMRMAVRLAKLIREGTRVNWLIARLAKIKGLGIHMPQLSNGGEGLGRKGWKEYAAVLDQSAVELKRKLHCDLRQKMKKNRAGRETRLTAMMQPATEEGGGREGAALSNGLRKKRDGAVDSAVITEVDQSTGESQTRAAADGTEVKESTLQYLKEWMGWGRSFWFHSTDGKVPNQAMGGVLWPESGGHMIYQDSDQGRAFRRRVVEGQLTEEDISTIPECFHRMLKYLERKQAVGGSKITAEDYSEAGLMQPISKQRWVQFWARAGAGKRGGESELHATLLKAAGKKVFMQTGPDGKGRRVAKTEHVVEGLRQLVNAARVGRFFYKDWTQELLYTFIKVPGAMGLENSRPVGLLEILQKASYAFDYAAITDVWERKGLLHNSQYAFRAKKGTEGPLLLWSLMNDRAYLNKEDQARGQGDLKHAYDGVQQWAVEVVLMRMGVPDDFVRYQTKLTVQTRTAVITPFGVTDKFRRASGLPQGGTHSCALWNGFIDIMAEMQHGMAKEKGVMVEDEWGKEWELLTQLFADDAHHCASGSRCVEGLEERFEIATLWSAFFGMEHRATKCNAVVGRWSGGEWAEDKRWTDGGVQEVVRIRDLHEGTAEEVPKVATGADQRALGVQVNMEGYWKGAAEKAKAEVEVTARAIRQMPAVKSLVERCGKAVGWQRLLYRLKLLSVPEGEARKICQPLRRAFLQKMGLPPGTAAAAADSYVWMAEQDELAVERVLLLMRMLGGGGVPARAVGGAVRELQRYVGCGEPVLETKHMRCKCSSREWSSCTSSCTEARQGSTGKMRCESTCGWNGTWLGVLYRHLSNSRLSLEGGRGMPLLREEDRFLVDIVDTEEVDMVREGCRAAGVWRVSEVRGLDGAELREAAQSGGSLERLVGKGKAGAKWGEVMRRVARARGGTNDVMGRRVRVGAGSRSSRTLGRWERTAVWDWSLVAWSEGGEIHLGIPQSGPGSRYLECRKLARIEGPPPKWMGRGTSQSALRRQLWKEGETTAQVDMELTKVWDTSTERSRVQKGGVWPVEASCVAVEGGQRWLLDALPAELSEQVFMQLREQGQEHTLDGQKEWGCSDWNPGVSEDQEGTVCWKGGSWGQQAAEECFAPGAELQLLGEGHDNMCNDVKWQQRLAEAGECNNWGVLDVYSDGGADGAGTPEASAEYGWIVGGTDEQSLETWAEGAARVGGLPEEMDSTRAELMGAYAVLHKVREWEGTVRIWVDNDNVVRGLEKRLGVERADAVWARSEVWAGSTQEEGDNWRVQLGEGSDGDLWEAVDLLLERMQGKVEVNWIRGHADRTTTRRMMSKHQRGNVRADANCTAVKRGARSRMRLPLPRRKSWRLCYDGVEMVGYSGRS